METQKHGASDPRRRIDDMFRSGTVGIGRTVPLSGLAWFLFAVGLISPLTPSEGRPGLITLAVFVGGPMVILGLIGLKSVHRIFRALGWLQLATLAYICLVGPVGGIPDLTS
jgi:hypothetical protein